MNDNWEERVVNATIELENEEFRTPKLPSLRKQKSFRGFLPTEHEESLIPYQVHSIKTFDDFLNEVA